MLALQSIVRFFVLVPEVSFFGTWKWALLANFCQTCVCFPVPKNGTLDAKTKNGDHFSCQHPSKMVDYLFVLCIYHFQVGFKPIFKNRIFLIVFELFFRTKKKCRGTAEGALKWNKSKEQNSFKINLQIQVDGSWFWNLGTLGQSHRALLSMGCGCASKCVVS